MSIINTEDSAVNVPVVPNANATVEWQRYLWVRNANAGAATKKDKVYTWNHHKVDDPTFLKWEEIDITNLLGVGSVTNEMLAGSISADKLLGSIGIAKLNLSGVIDDTHIDSISPDKISDLSGVNTGDQTISYASETGVLTLSGDDPVTINAAPTWNSGTKTLTFTYGSVVLSGYDAVENAVTAVTPTANKYHLIEIGSNDNTWYQISLLDTTLVTPGAQQLTAVLSSAGTYMVTGQIGIVVESEHNNYDGCTIEVGIVNVTANANAVTPASKAHIVRKHVFFHDAIQFSFMVTTEAAQTWKFVYRGVNMADTDEFPTNTLPGIPEYVRPDTWVNTGLRYGCFDSNQSYINYVRLA